MSNVKKKKMSLSGDVREIDKEAVKAFAGGVQISEPKEPPKLDPKAKPTKGFNLRLNEYQLDKITKLADREGRSIQKEIVRTMMLKAESIE